MSKNLEDYTVIELRNMLKKKGITGYSNLRKNQLISKLRGNKRKGNRSRKSKSISRSPKRKNPSIYKGHKNNKVNSYFSKIFIINLHDKTTRWNKVTSRFIKKGIKYQRFEALDGRCKTDKECKEKRKNFEKEYKVKISRSVNTPVASLMIGIISLLRKQVKNKWKHMLICEDDIVPSRNFNTRFNKGVKELKDNHVEWDMLFLGCGGECGHKGVSWDKTAKNKYLTSWVIADPDEEYYVSTKDDLRWPCEESECYPITQNISNTIRPGGGWSYSWSLAGAKKTLKLLNNKVDNHMDQKIIQAVDKGKIKAVAFDPPVIYHEAGAVRPDTDLPW
jgi:hypothetical protein